MFYELLCTKCGKISSKEPAYRCLYCGGILHPVYHGRFSGDREMTGNYPGILRYAERLPLDKDLMDRGFLVSMSEGDTPLVSMPHVRSELGLSDVYYKCEQLNPTGSFKDRGMAVAFTKALQMNIRDVVLASAGNASSSAAAYGARAGINVHTVVPSSTTRAKVTQALMHGAELIERDGTYSDTYAEALKISGEKNWFNVTTTHINPYLVEGYKTCAYELAEKMGDSIDWIFVPIGAGPFLTGIYRGFQELQEEGRISHIPHMAGVQSDRCSPIAKAWQENMKVRACRMTMDTCASGLNDELRGYEDDGDEVIRCVNASGGAVTALSEEEIRQSVYECLHEGLYLEPASAAALGALRKLRGREIVKAGETVVLAATGHGLKSNYSAWITHNE